MKIHRVVGWAVAVTSCCALLSAPAALADPPSLPRADSEPADVTIHAIEAMGYNVSINWSNGQSSTPLSNCRVNDVNGTDVLHGQGTVYVGVVCP
jgi:hypothetical protein